MILRALFDETVAEIFNITAWIHVLQDMDAGIISADQLLSCPAMMHLFRMNPTTLSTYFSGANRPTLRTDPLIITLIPTAQAGGSGFRRRLNYG